MRLCSQSLRRVGRADAGAKLVRAAGIPDDMTYRPKTAIALELYDRAVANGVRFRWLTFDEWYGVKPAFLRGLDARRQDFVGEVHKDFTAWARRPRVTGRRYRRGGRGRSRTTPRLVAGSPGPMPVGEMLARRPELRDQPWRQYYLRDGTKGPMVWEAKRTLIWPKDDRGLPGPAYHLVVCRNVLAPDEVKYFVSNAASNTAVPTLLLVAFSRWRVERCFEDEKGELGLDHYEGRSYLGLKRHLILTAVSHLFLAEAHQRLRGEKSGPNGVPGADGDERGGAELVADGLNR